MRDTENPVRFFLALLFTAAFTFGTALGGEGLTSSMDMIFDANYSYDGIRIVPANIPGKRYTEDHSPSQVLEIIRPNGGPISIGRLITSCACLSASMERKDFAQGERALIEVRNVKPSPVQGATFAVIAQLASPYRTALQYDMTLEPAGSIPAAAATPTAPKPVVKPTLRYEDIVPYAPGSDDNRIDPKKVF